MEDQEVIDKINKLEYQVKVLSRTVDFKENPIENLILEKDWGREDLSHVSAIFDRWEDHIRNEGGISEEEFEASFREGLGIGYQDLKPIILAFYRNESWVDVCEAYVDSMGENPPVEYHSIRSRER